MSARVTVLVCLLALLATSFLAPVHRHTGSHDACCLACQVSEGAPLVPVEVHAGEPDSEVHDDLPPIPGFTVLSEPSLVAYGPRPPPSLILSA